MKYWFLILALAAGPAVQSATFELPTGEFDLVGYQLEIEAEFEDTLLDIARHHGIGQEEIVNANPDVDRWLPGAGTQVTIPSRYILPDAPRKGLVLNLPEMRIYYFPEPEQGEPAQVQTYPVSIGRMDWNTPLGETRITEKRKDPPWYPPQSVREEHEREGDPLPRVVPPGPDNPLGRHAMRLALPSYLIHGTNKTFGVGMRVSHGCIRMLPEDIEYLFPQVPVGTPVQIINQPVKAGWYGGELYVEVHPPLEEYDMDMAELDEELTRVLDDVLAKRFTQLDESAVADVLARRSGLPEVVSLTEGW